MWVNIRCCCNHRSARISKRQQLHHWHCWLTTLGSAPLPTEIITCIIALSVPQRRVPVYQICLSLTVLDFIFQVFLDSTLRHWAQVDCSLVTESIEVQLMCQHTSRHCLTVCTAKSPCGPAAGTQIEFDRLDKSLLGLVLSPDWINE
jgi:hypothetical protein